MNVIEILKAAKAKIEDPAHWTQGYYARTAEGTEVLGNEPAAVCFCSLGAVEAATGTIHCGQGWPKAAEEFLSQAAKLTAPEMFSIANFNDERTHEEVLAVFDKATELATNATVVSNLETLLVAVEAQPEEQFDLSNFRRDVDDSVCGTLFCTVGLACTMPKFQAEGFELVATPQRRDPGKFFYHVEVNGEDIRDTDVTDPTFGEGAWFNLFTPSGEGRFDNGFGYVFDPFGDVEPNMTDKALAVARLKKQIENLKGAQV